jgi:hypothetical protein
MKLLTKRKTHYDNVLILDCDGSPISTIDLRRLDFYKKNNLVDKQEDREGYSSVYKLKFKANIAKGVSEINYLPVENICVISGDNNDLTLHHVVPYCIRKHLPVKYKGRSREWCVLLRDDIHSMVEDEVTKLYQKDMDRYFKTHSKGISKYKKRFEMLRLIEGGYWDNIPHEKQIKIMMQSHVHDFDHLLNLSINDIQSKYNKKKDKIYRNWVYDYIDRNGGVKKTYQMFGDHFKKTFKPKYLPKGYLEWYFD